MKKILAGFKTFILRGNVIDLAVGIVIGSAFTSLVNAIVKDLITPTIWAIIKVPDFSNLKFTIRGSVFDYGDFLNVALSFLIVAISVYFFIVVPMNFIAEKTKKKEEKEVAVTTKKCPDCASEVPVEAKKCKYCLFGFEN